MVYMKDNPYSNMTSTAAGMAASANTPFIDIDRLAFPKEIAPIIGVRKESISFWKKKGCQFVGRKTSIRWVRNYLEKISGGIGYGIA